MCVCVGEIQYNRIQYNRIQCRLYYHLRVQSIHLFELFQRRLFVLFALFAAALHLLGHDAQVDELFFQANLVSHDDYYGGTD